MKKGLQRRQDRARRDFWRKVEAYASPSERLVKRGRRRLRRRVAQLVT